MATVLTSRKPSPAQQTVRVQRFQSGDTTSSSQASANAFHPQPMVIAHQAPAPSNDAPGHRNSQVFTDALGGSKHRALCVQAESYLNANGRAAAPRSLCAPELCFAELGDCLIGELLSVAKLNTAAYLGLRQVSFVGSMPPPPEEPVTLFQSSLLPPMLPQEFVNMIVRNTRCDPNLVTLGAVLILRYCEKQTLPPTLHMLHRMIGVSIQVATKTHKDRFLRNDLAARLCGLSPQEMNRLEVELIHGCEWQTLVLADELVNGSALVERFRSASVENLRKVDLRKVDVERTNSLGNDSIGYAADEQPSPQAAGVVPHRTPSDHGMGDGPNSEDDDHVDVKLGQPRK